MYGESFLQPIPLSSDRWQTEELVIDLGRFTCGNSRLGKPIDSQDFFAPYLVKTDVFKNEGEGFEIGTKDLVFDYLYLKIGDFEGEYLYHGKPVALSRATTLVEIQSLFGEPYWIDSSDRERIAFYEYEAGRIELQFEFPEGKNLEIITLLRDGVLSDPSDRRSYGVTAPWPPLDR